jgi:hypothetical protein
MAKSLALLVLLALTSLAQKPNWTGPYKPCLDNAEVKKTGHMNVGVRYDISDRFRCELCSGQVDGVEINADHSEQSFQRAAAPGRIDHFVRALIPAVPAVV